MNRDSELRFLTGSLGINGETRKPVIRNAVLAYGAKNPLHGYSGDTAGDVYRAIFGESP